MTATTSPEAGTRIRERRIDIGMRQADLAQNVGISPSYLNLIEHNRRRIAGKLLGDIARALDVDAGILNDGAERETVQKMLSAASQLKSNAEIQRTEEIAARYPGWAALIAEQSDRIAGLELKVHELTQRMSHDPSLAASLHAVISSVTSIRSAASILNSDENLDSDWQDRFHRNIHTDAIRLASDSDALVKFLEQPNTGTAPKSPIDEVETWFLENATVLRSLELDPASAGSVLNAAAMSQPAKALLQIQIQTYIKDAARLPLEDFAQLARDHDYHPEPIWRATGAGFSQVLRRLSTLAPEDGHPPMGLAECDSTGALLFQRRSVDFALFRSGDVCANWPMFAAMGQLGRIVTSNVLLPGHPATKLRCYAVATQSEPDPNAMPIVKSTMLVISASVAANASMVKVGPTCRICPHSDCAARREASVVATTI